MPGVKVTNFMGVAPKISPELLPDTAAQIARNTKLYSGDLIPYTNPVVKANALRTGVIRTIHALREPGTKALKWLTWPYDVDIVVATPDIEQDLDQRYYFSGYGSPKVSNYELSFGGPAPFPFNWYDLGLPLPETSQTLTTIATPLVTSTSVSFSRDNANTATIITSAPHKLVSGNEVTITGFAYRGGTYTQSGSTITVTIAAHGLAVGASVVLNFKSGDAIDSTFTVTSVTNSSTFVVTATNSDNTSGNVDWDIRSFNAQNAEVTVVNATEFTYFSPGSAVATTPNANGKISLAGDTQERKYVFTWYTPWEEESIASEPSETLYIKEGQVVTVTNIPTEKPDGNNFVRGVRLYRTLPSASETEYYLLQTLWFPVPLDVISRTDNVVTVQTYYPHNLDPEDRFKLAYCSDTTYNVEGAVIDVLDQYTFTYAQTAADSAEAVVTGYVYHDISESPDKTPRYWGYATYAFYDDFDSKALTTILPSDDYDAPPSGLRGLTVIQNNILAGFVGNTVFFSEPKTPHAWPKKYAQVLEYPVVGLSVISGSLVVLTEGYPYLISGSDPAAGMSVQKVDALFPCVSRRSIVKLANMVAYATNDGLAVYSPFAGSQLITKYNYNDDTWKADLDPSTIIAGYYNEAYFASYGNAKQDDDAVEEPTPPTIPLPDAPPAPTGTDPDGSGGGSSEVPPTPGDPALLYSGDVTTAYWSGTPPEISGSIGGRFYGAIAAGIHGASSEYGVRSPSLFYDTIESLAEVTVWRGFFFKAPNTRSYIAISGYSANPIGTANEPILFNVGGILITPSSRDSYSYASGVARWMWYGDKFAIYGKTGVTKTVSIRKAP